VQLGGCTEIDEASSHGDLTSRWPYVIFSFDGSCRKSCPFRAVKLGPSIARLNATREAASSQIPGNWTRAKLLASGTRDKKQNNGAIKTAPLPKRFSPRRGAAREWRATSDFSSRIGFKINVVSPFRLLIASGRSPARTNRLLQ